MTWFKQVEYLCICTSHISRVDDGGRSACHTPRIKFPEEGTASEMKDRQRSLDGVHKGFKYSVDVPAIEFQARGKSKQDLHTRSGLR